MFIPPSARHLRFAGGFQIFEVFYLTLVFLSENSLATASFDLRGSGPQAAIVGHFAHDNNTTAPAKGGHAFPGSLDMTDNSSVPQTAMSPILISDNR